MTVRTYKITFRRRDTRWRELPLSVEVEANVPEGTDTYEEWEQATARARELLALAWDIPLRVLAEASSEGEITNPEAVYVKAGEKGTFYAQDNTFVKVTGKPVHPEDCTNPSHVFLGCRVDDRGQRDIYFCDQGCGIPTILSRYGADGDYSSGWPHDDNTGLRSAGPDVLWGVVAWATMQTAKPKPKKAKR